MLVITMISDRAQTNSHFSAKAVKILHTFLRFDPLVFQIFRPNKPLLMKMQLDEHILSLNPVASEDALELTYFLLRYHRAVDFGDFSEQLHVTQRIRRFHDYKVWFELENLTGSQDDLQGSFSEFKQMTQNALREIMDHLEKVSADSGGLKSRIDHDMTQLNAQIERYKAQALLASQNDEKYKSLVDLVMHLENKLNISSRVMVSDLRRELTESFHHQSRGTALQTDLESLKQELQKFVGLSEARNESSYKRLYETLDSLETKYDQRFSTQIDQLKTKLEELIFGRHSQLEQADLLNLQKMQDLLRVLESKVDVQTQELVRNLQQEIANAKQSQSASLDTSFSNLQQ